MNPVHPIILLSTYSIDLNCKYICILNGSQIGSKIALDVEFCNINL